MTLRSIKLAVSVAAALGAVAFGPASADARKVNTGTGSSVTTVGTVNSGLIDVKGTSFDLATLSPRISLTGTVNSAGVWNVPTSGVNFPPLTIPNDTVGTVTVRFQPSEAWTGTVNPLTGAGTLNAHFKIKLEGGSGLTSLGGSCYLNGGNPVDVPATTGTSGTVVGTPYSAASGTMTVVNNTATIGNASGCGLGGAANGPINDALSLPVTSGQAKAIFDIAFNPILTKGIDAAFNTSQPGGQFTPSTVNFDAGPSTRIAGSTFRWDFDNNGTYDTAASTSATTSHVYSTPGTYTAKLEVDDGTDKSTTTRTITVLGRPDLKVTQTHSPSDFRSGAPGSFGIAVDNLGDGPTTGTTTITDTLPAGLTYTGFTGTGWTCGAVAQLVTCTRTAAIGAGASAPALTINADVGPAAVPEITNTATAATAANETVTSNNADSETVDVEAIDLALDKSHTGNFRPNRNSKYKLVVTNNGDHATVGPTTVTDTLPARLGWVADDAPDGWTCQTVGQVVTCTTNDPVAPGASAEIELTVQPGDGPSGDVTNTATVATAADVDTSDNTDSDPTSIVATPDLIVDKSHTGNFRAGTQGSYSIKVTNDGAQDTSGDITVTDTLPTGLDFVAAAGTGWNCGATGQDVTCTRTDALAPDASAPTITVDVMPTAAAAPTVTNTATVANTSDQQPGNNSDSDPTTVNRVDLALDKSHVGGFRVGDTGTYELDVQNVGTAQTYDTVTVTDTLPTGFDYQGASGAGWSCSATGQVVTCTRSGAILAGAHAPKITLDVGVTQAGDVTNNASVATTGDVNPANDADADATAITTVDLALTKSHNGNFRVGTTRSYTIGVKNEGAFASTSTTTVTDTLPAGLTYVGYAGAGWSCSASGQDVTCTRAAQIASGATAPNIVLQVAVGPAAAPSVTNTAHVDTDNDRNEANDSASDPTTVVYNDLSLSVAHPSGGFRVGRTGVYTATVHNAGVAATAGAATVTTTLPAGLTYSGSAGDAWSCSAVAQAVTCAHSGAIAPDTDAQPLEIHVGVAPAAAPSRDTTWGVAVPNDPVATNDSDDDTVPVQTVDLDVDNAHVGDFAAGGNGHYTIGVDNVGDAPTDSSTKVTETLPAGVTYVNATGSDWSCSRDGQAVTCRHAGAIPAGGGAADIDLEVQLGHAAVPQVVTTATVDNSDDANAANDSDGDTAPVTAKPDAALSVVPVVRPDGRFQVGTDAAYTLAVRNVGGAPTTGPTTAKTTLPAGVTFRSGSGTGWTCGAAGQDVTCTHATPLADESRSDVRLEVGLGAAAAPAVTLEGTVATPGDADATNDKGRATTPVGAVDVRATIRHFGNFRSGQPGAWTVAVGNVGNADTTGPVTFTHRVPDGMVLREITADPAWTCEISGQDVTCRHLGQLAAGANAPAITIGITPSDANRPTVRGSATASTPGDVTPANDTDSDEVPVDEKLGSSPPIAPPSQPEAPATTLAMTGGKLKLTKSGAAEIKLTCGGAQVCAGKLELVTTKKVKGKLLKAGSGRFSVPAGGSKVVKVKLTVAARKELAKKKKLDVQATATLVPAVQGVAPASATLQLLPSAKARKR